MIRRALSPPNDQADVDAICEAVMRTTMVFVPVQSADRHAALLCHGTRGFLVPQQLQTVTAIRAHLGEFGIVMPQGIHNVDRLLAAAGDVPRGGGDRRPRADPRLEWRVRGQCRDHARNRPLLAAIKAGLPGFAACGVIGPGWMGAGVVNHFHVQTPDETGFARSRATVARGARRPRAQAKRLA